MSEARGLSWADPAPSFPGANSRRRLPPPRARDASGQPVPARNGPWTTYFPSFKEGDKTGFLHARTRSHSGCARRGGVLRAVGTLSPPHPCAPARGPRREGQRVCALWLKGPSLRSPHSYARGSHVPRADTWVPSRSKVEKMRSEFTVPGMGAARERESGQSPPREWRASRRSGRQASLALRSKANRPPGPTGFPQSL